MIAWTTEFPRYMYFIRIVLSYLLFSFGHVMEMNNGKDVSSEIGLEMGWCGCGCACVMRARVFGVMRFSSGVAIHSCRSLLFIVEHRYFQPTFIVSLIPFFPPFISYNRVHPLPRSKLLLLSLKLNIIQRLKYKKQTH